MVGLKVERCTEALPFTYCGVDMVRPYLIKDWMSHLKRYGVLFRCFTCRTIHIVVTYALDTNFFILTLRRFMIRRGAVRSILVRQWTKFCGNKKLIAARIQGNETIKLRTSCKKTKQIRLTGIIIHQQHHIWVVFGSVKSEQIQLWTKYLRQTLVFMWNSTLWENFNFYFSTFFC